MIMPDHAPITGSELEEMRRRCEKALHVPLSKMSITLAHQSEDLVAMQATDAPTFEQCIRDLPRCLAEIERLQSGLRSKCCQAPLRWGHESHMNQPPTPLGFTAHCSACKRFACCVPEADAGNVELMAS